MVDKAGAQPSHAQHTNTCGHTGLEDRRIQNISSRDLGHHNDDGGSGEHDRHNGFITWKGRVGDKPHLLRGQGGPRHHDDDGYQEHENRSLGTLLRRVVPCAEWFLDQALCLALQVNRIIFKLFAKLISYPGSWEDRQECRRNNDRQYLQIAHPSRL